jgi:hypothetical protein
LERSKKKKVMRLVCNCPLEQDCGAADQLVLEWSKKKGYETDLSLSSGARLWSRRPVRLERSMKKGSDLKSCQMLLRLLASSASIWSKIVERLENNKKKGSSSPVTVLWCKIVEPQTG